MRTGHLTAVGLLNLFAAPVALAVPTWGHTTAATIAAHDPVTSPCSSSMAGASASTAVAHGVHHHHPSPVPAPIIGTPGPVIVSSPLGAVEVINRCPFNVGSNVVHAPRVKGKKPEEVRGVLAKFSDAGAGPHRVVGADGAGKVNGTIAGAKGVMSHPYLHDPNLGVSWKLSKVGENGRWSGPVQFEWTWVPKQERVYWDLSMIDATTNKKRQLLVPDIESHVDVDARDVHHPFAPYGITVTPMVNGRNVTAKEGGGNCVPVVCPRNSGVCSQAYNVWNDWKQQRDCGEHDTMRIVLCA